MPIKVTNDFRSTPKTSEYPKLMISDRGLVVLFEDFGRGTVLQKGDGATKLASYSTTFNMAIFSNYEGKLIIENDNQ